MIKIAIISRPDFSSPRVLAECLHEQIKEANYSSDIYFRADVLKRLVNYKEVKSKYPFYVWSAYKLVNYLKDIIFLRKLRAYDVIIVSECTPSGFLDSTLNVERLRKILRRVPILYYEVYFLGNAPTIIEYLENNKQNLIDRYDWHLAVSEVTEIRSKPTFPWSQIGLNLKSTGLKPRIKKNLLAVVDFLRPGHESLRELQIQVLKELEIPYVSLERKYTFQEIRNIYSEATFYFMQSMEAFGLPIAECLSGGCYIFTPDSSWPMSWRLDDNPKIHGKGKLAECFIVYEGYDSLKEKLRDISITYDLSETPKKVFEIFHRNYGSFYEGSINEIKNILSLLESNKLIKS